MRILLCSTSAILTPPEAYGGMEREVAWLADALRARGNEVMVVAREGSTVEGHIGGKDDEQSFIEVAKAHAGQFEIILDFSHDKTITRVFDGFPQINTYQVMVIQHDVNPVFISKAQRAHCKRLEAPVIYYGLNVEEYPFYDGPREDYLLYMGSIIAEKRVGWVTELGDRLGLPVKLAGPCWQPEYFATFDAMKEMDHVEWVGDVGGAEKLELIQKARALVHPVGGLNWVEAGAIIALEALMVGTPVIASTNGCLPEYIVDFMNGFTCNSVAEMAEVFKWLDQVDPIACRHSVTGKFTKERMATEYEHLAKEVLGGRRW